MIPREVFFTSGVGKHCEKLVSFELALRDAGIEKFNLVKVSSVLPPRCKFISREEGIRKLNTGEIVFVVMSEISSNSPGDIVIASIGCAYPKKRNKRGYIAEYSTKNENEEEARKKSEKMAKFMLESLLDNREDIETLSVSASSLVEKREWVTAIAAAVFVL
ncbi:MAG: arginine decarboxylase, pyruvoyl-dependent [Thermoplasmata archaeon]|nr:MAG: arginine decarboxylase, pyruvoyl-dependent [Thermoplasmata archaeon]